MPELPEVTVVANGLDDFIRHKKISSVEILSGGSLKASRAQQSRFLLGAGIKSVGRVGKLIVISLSTGYYLVIHLKMTGQLIFRDQDRTFAGGHPGPSWLNQLPDNSSRLIFNLAPSGRLFFNDSRRFGWCRLVAQVELESLTAHLGPDALTVSLADFKAALASRRKTIKACLLDQTIIAGPGNIYADESLWQSRIHPVRPANSLTKAEVNRLLQALQTVLKDSIDQGGSSLANYVDARGRSGNYLDSVKAYGRTGQACYRCHRILVRTRVAGRTSHYCPRCQVWPGRSKAARPIKS